jgi:hypothetical protein
MVTYVRTVIAAEGIAPSYAMICRAMGIRTRQEVSRLVSGAERTGELKRVGTGKVRRIRLHGALSELC